MVSPTKLVVHFAKAEPTSLSASPSHLKTEKSENNSRLCGKFWPKSSKFSSLKEMTQVHSLSRSQVSQCQGSQKRRGKMSVQTCSIWKRTVVSSLKPAIRLRIARPMCDGRLSPPGFFAAWRVEAPFFHYFPFRWDIQFALSLARCLTFQDAAPCYRKDSLYECGRPHDTLSCLFFTALWLRQGQSILTQVQHTNDIDLTFYKTFLTKSVTCLQVGPMSLEWPVAPPAESDQSSLSPSQ